MIDASSLNPNTTTLATVVRRWQRALGALAKDAPAVRRELAARVSEAYAVQTHYMRLFWAEYCRRSPCACARWQRASLVELEAQVYLGAALIRFRSVPAPPAA